MQRRQTRPLPAPRPDETPRECECKPGQSSQPQPSSFSSRLLTIRSLLMQAAHVKGCEKSPGVVIGAMVLEGGACGGIGAECGLGGDGRSAGAPQGPGWGRFAAALAPGSASRPPPRPPLPRASTPAESIALCCMPAAPTAAPLAPSSTLALETCAPPFAPSARRWETPPPANGADTPPSPARSPSTGDAAPARRLLRRD